MRAIVHHRYGDPAEAIRLDDIDVPALPDDAVLVRVVASSLNAGDWRQVRADPSFVRLVEGIRRPRNPVLGGDVAGVVERVGSAVSGLAVGDEVYGIRTGALAEYVAGKVMTLKPANLTFEQAAAVPIAGVTALQAVRDHGRLRAGQSVLVNGAGGGVGTMAVQLAKALGGRVTATTSAANLELVRSLGADEIIDYARTDFTTGPTRYDLVIDVGGTPTQRRQLRALAPGGRLVRVGAGKGRGGPILGLVTAMLRSKVLRQPIASFIAKVRVEDLETLRELIEAGTVRPVIDRTYELEETVDALRYLETERARGKVVIRVAPSQTTSGGTPAAGDQAPR